MSTIGKDTLVVTKQHLLDASNDLMAVFDAIEDGQVTPQAALRLVEASKHLNAVHDVFQHTALRALLAQSHPRR